MAVTSNAKLADRMRLMSLHVLSADAWGRYASNGSWDYKIVAPGYKYNLTDIAAAIGIHQLGRADAMRREREEIARTYREAFATISQLELPAGDANRIESFHLFSNRLRVKSLQIYRDEFIDGVKLAQLGRLVH